MHREGGERGKDRHPPTEAGALAGQVRVQEGCLSRVLHAMF